MDFQSVEKSFQDAVAEGVFPGAVVLVAKDERIVYEQAFGNRSLVPNKSPMRLDTIFDLASLTKPMATAAALMLLIRERKLRLDDQLTRVIAPSLPVASVLIVGLGKDRDEVYRRAVEMRPKRFAIVYTGKMLQGTEIVL